LGKTSQQWQMARMKLEAHCATFPNLDWWVRATL